MQNDPPRSRIVLAWYLGALIALSLTAWTLVFLRGGQPYPRNTFLFIPEARFSDFTIYTPHFREFGNGLRFFQAAAWPFTYPPVAAFAFLPFMKLGAGAVVCYVATIVSAIVVFGILLCRRVRRLPGFKWMVTLTLATVCLSYPFLFLLDRANVEGVLWILLAAGFVTFVKDRQTLAAVLFGLAAAMKIYPAMILLVFIARRQYRYAVIGAATAVVSTVLALAALGPSLPEAARNIGAGLAFFNQTYALGYRPTEIGFDHSGFAVVKQVLLLFVGADGLPAALPAAHRFYAVAVVVIAGLLYWTRVRHMPVLNVWLFSCTAMILFPFVSTDYTLVHLYLPWAGFVVYLSDDVEQQQRAAVHGRLIVAALAFAVLFTPQSYLLVATVGLGGQVKALALIALLYVAASTPMRSSLFTEPLPAPARQRPASHLPDLLPAERPSA